MDADAIARVQQLADMKAAGVLTEEEFAEQKSAILGASGKIASNQVAPAPGGVPIPQAQGQPIIAVQPGMQGDMMQAQMQAQMQLQLSRDPSQPFPGRIETEEIKGCYIHWCPAPPLAWYAIGCLEPKGSDTIGDCAMVGTATPFFLAPGPPWLPMCGEYQRVPGTNAFAAGSSKLHVTKSASGKIGITAEDCCVWGNKYVELC